MDVVDFADVFHFNNFINDSNATSIGSMPVIYKIDDDTIKYYHDNVYDVDSFLSS